MNTKELDGKYVAGTYARFPIVLTEGKGSLVRDEEGKEYIDMGSGIAVNAFGIADDIWAAAVSAQLGKLQHCSNLYFSEPCAKLAAVLCEKTGMKKVFFGNSGAEANECAIKAARKAMEKQVRSRQIRPGAAQDRDAREQLPRPHHRYPDRHGPGRHAQGLPAPSARLSVYARERL